MAGTEPWVLRLLPGASKTAAADLGHPAPGTEDGGSSSGPAQGSIPQGKGCLYWLLLALFIAILDVPLVLAPLLQLAVATRFYEAEPPVFVPVVVLMLVAMVAATVCLYRAVRWMATRSPGDLSHGLRRRWRWGSPAVVFVAVLALATIAVVRAPADRGSATPGKPPASTGRVVPIAWSTTRPDAWHEADARGPTTPSGSEMTFADLSIRFVGDSTPNHETGRLVATGADNTIAWASKRLSSAVVTMWQDGEQVLSLWRRIDIDAGFDNTRTSARYLLIAFDGRTGRELWWVDAFDSWAGGSNQRFDLIIGDDALVLTSANQDYGQPRPDYVAAIDPATGSARWRYEYPQDGAVTACDAARAGTVVQLICDGSEGRVYASIDLFTGARR